MEPLVAAASPTTTAGPADEVDTAGSNPFGIPDPGSTIPSAAPTGEPDTIDGPESPTLVAEAPDGEPERAE